MILNFNIFTEVINHKQALFSTEKVLSRGAAETTLERSDDGPKGEVFIYQIKKPHKSRGVTC